MEKWTRFNSYDFFAYLISGILLLALFDYIFPLNWWKIDDGWEFSDGVLIFIFAYIAGHIVASFSRFFYEYLLTERFLYPPNVLVMDLEKPRFRERLFSKLVGGSGFKTETEGNRKKVKEACIESGGLELKVKNINQITRLGRKYMRIDNLSQNRVESFENLSGFCRNIAMISSVSMFLFLVKLLCNLELKEFFNFLISVFVWIVFTLRYVKFYYSYRYELLRQIWQKVDDKKSN